MDATATKMYNNMKMMIENNMAATSAMIQQSISTAFNRALQGESNPKKFAFGPDALSKTPHPMPLKNEVYNLHPRRHRI
eukprot:4930634-Ditylum_brightwellii.AAC.1